MPLSVVTGSLVFHTYSMEVPGSHDQVCEGPTKSSNVIPG
jgi:hypothetical protein